MAQRKEVIAHHRSHNLVMIGLLYEACPDGCQQVLPGLRPYPMRGHLLLYHRSFPQAHFHQAVTLAASHMSCTTACHRAVVLAVVQHSNLTLCMLASSGVVQEVFNRHSEMSDPAMANVDQIILVMSLNLPPFDARQATRFLVSAEAADIPVMLLLNKADLQQDDTTQALVAEVTDVVVRKLMCLTSQNEHGLSVTGH